MSADLGTRPALTRPHVTRGVHCTLTVHRQHPYRRMETDDGRPDGNVSSKHVSLGLAQARSGSLRLATITVVTGKTREMYEHRGGEPERVV